MWWFCHKCKKNTDFIEHPRNTYSYICTMCKLTPLEAKREAKQGPLQLVRRPRNDPY